MKKTDTYKIGVKKTSISEIGGGFDVSFYCSCGNKRTGTYLNRRDIPVVDACPDCGNDYFLENIPEDKYLNNMLVVGEMCSVVYPLRCVEAAVAEDGSPLFYIFH